MSMLNVSEMVAGSIASSWMVEPPSPAKPWRTADTVPNAGFDPHRLTPGPG